jgi:hypothetical protein
MVFVSFCFGWFSCYLLYLPLTVVLKLNTGFVGNTTKLDYHMSASRLYTANINAKIIKTTGQLTTTSPSLWLSVFLFTIFSLLVCLQLWHHYQYTTPIAEAR